MKRIQIFLFTFVVIIGTSMNGLAWSADSPEEKKRSLSDLYQGALDLSETIKIAGKELAVAEKDKDRAFAVNACL